MNQPRAEFLDEQRVRMATVCPHLPPSVVHGALKAIVAWTKGDETAIRQAVDGWVFRATHTHNPEQARLN